MGYHSVFSNTQAKTSLFLYWLTNEIICIKPYPHCVFLLNQYNSQSTQRRHQNVLSTYYLHSYKELPNWCEELCVNLINSLLESSICFKFCILTVNVYNSNQSFFYINWNLLYRNTMVWIEEMNENYADDFSLREHMLFHLRY